MKHVVASMLVAFAIAGVALSPFALAVSVTEGSDASGMMLNAPMLDKTTKRVKCEQATRGPSVTLPGSSAHAWNTCASVTTTYADYCGNVANGIPCLDSATKISTSVLPTSVMTGTGTTDVIPKKTASGYADSYLEQFTNDGSLVGETGSFIQPRTDNLIELGQGSGGFTPHRFLRARFTSFVEASNIDQGGNTTGAAALSLLASTSVSASGGDYAFAYRTGTNTVTNTATGTNTSCPLNRACTMVRTSTTTATATVTNSVNGYAISSNPVLTYTDVGADISGAATSAVNAAVSGAAGYVPYFSASHTLVSLAPYGNTPAAYAIPISDGAAKLDSWITGSTQKAVYNYSDGNVFPAIDSTWHNVAAHTFTLAGGSVVKIHAEAIFADAYNNARTCGITIMADNGGTASTLRSVGGWLNAPVASTASSAIISGYYLNGSAATDAQVVLSAGTTTVAVALFAVTGGYNCYVPTGLLTTLVQVF